MERDLGDFLAENNIFATDTHGRGGQFWDVDTRPDFSLLTQRFDRSSEIHQKAIDHRLERLLSHTLLFGDLKSSKSEDPCRHITTREDLPANDRRRNDENVDSSVLSRGQMISYAHAIIGSSHRAFVFGFVIFPDHARLLRFDMSGVIYSALFPIRDTTHLGDFFQRIAVASPLEKGYDPSVHEVEIDAPCVQTAKQIFHQALKDLTIPSTVTWNDTFGTPIWPGAHYWLFDVYDTETQSFHRVLTYHPSTCPSYFGGRGTRGFVGVDLTIECVVYMKRSWRINHPEIYSERELYRSLQAGKVRHLPDCFFGGDVPSASAERAADFWDSGGVARPAHNRSTRGRNPPAVESVCLHGAFGLALRLHALARANGTLTTHTLHIVLFKKVGAKLSTFRRSHDLGVAIRDALESKSSDSVVASQLMTIITAHKDAYDLGILHRDISIGNILIYTDRDKKPEGLLIDWDLSAPVSRANRGPRREARTVSLPSPLARGARSLKMCLRGPANSCPLAFCSTLIVTNITCRTIWNPSSTS